MLRSSSFRLALLTLLLIWGLSALLLFFVTVSVIDFAREQATNEIDENYQEIIDALPWLHMEQSYGNIEYQDFQLDLEAIEALGSSLFLSRYLQVIQTTLSDSDVNEDDTAIAAMLLRARLYLLDELPIDKVLNAPIPMVVDLMLDETPEHHHEILESIMDARVDDWYEHHQHPKELTREALLAYIDEEELIENEWICFALRSPAKKVVTSSHNAKDFTINERQDNVFDITVFYPNNHETPSARCLVKAIPMANKETFYFGHRPDWYFGIKEWLEGVLVLGLAITFVLAMAATWFLSRRTLMPIEAINKVCNAIQNGDFTERLPINGSGDDFDRLAGNINQMLDQIQELMQGVQDVTDNIAHDLRTPLTRLRGQLDLMMRMENPDKSALEALTYEVDHVLAMFSGLLRIARIEKGKRKVAFQKFNLNEVVNDLCEFYEPALEEKHISLSKSFAPGDLLTTGDPELWTQALSNLLDNAYKYTPENGCIAVTTQKKSQGVVVILQDSGPGIPDHEKENVFKRFYRLDKHRSGKGTGLGLSMVKAVCDLHHANIQLHNHQGLQIKILIPNPR